MSPLTIALLCTGLLLLVIILWVIVSHNGFVRLRNLVQEAWRQIDVELNRRHDLIPNLLETVRGYMSYEQSTLQAVVEARRLAEAPAANLAEAVELTPGLQSPTISPLHEAGWYAVRSMVETGDVNRVMDDLYRIGARGIIVTPVLACRI